MIYDANFFINFMTSRDRTDDKNNVNKVVESYLEKQGRIKGLIIVATFHQKLRL